MASPVLETYYVMTETLFHWKVVTLWWEGEHGLPSSSRPLPLVSPWSPSVIVSGTCCLDCCCCLVVQSCLTLCDLWTVARQAPLPMGFSRQEYWSGLPCPPPGDLPDPGIECTSLVSPSLQIDFQRMSQGSLIPQSLVFLNLLFILY